MQNQAFLYGVIGLLAGSLITILVAQNAVNTNNMQMMRMMGMGRGGMMDEMKDMMSTKGGSRKEEEEESPAHHMEEMMEPLMGKKGVDFDRTFTELMIVHHQGAIDMARDAKEKAEHPELKKLADDIISAQTKEIEMMKDWQLAWGYK